MLRKICCKKLEMNVMINDLHCKCCRARFYMASSNLVLLSLIIPATHLYFDIPDCFENYRSQLTHFLPAELAIIKIIKIWSLRILVFNILTIVILITFKKYANFMIFALLFINLFFLFAYVFHCTMVLKSFLPYVYL